MSHAIYEAVVLLLEQLTADEKQQLIQHLTEENYTHNLSDEEFWSSLKAAQVTIPAGKYFSDKREDWYQ